jgi:type II secretory pathway pseudopilin PulG
MQRHNDTAGLTLVEIMVAIGIVAIVVASVMDSFVVQNRAYTVVDQTTETQQNIRAVAQLLDQDLRMTGFMVPEGAAVCGIDAVSAAVGPNLLAGSDIIYVTDSDPIDPTNQTQANLGAKIQSGYSPATVTLNLADMTVDGKPYYDTDGNGAADSDFRPKGGVIVMDTSNPSRGTACGTIESVNPGANQIRVDFETGFAAGGGTLIAVPAHRYAVTDQNVLRRDDTDIVRDVDDLQLAYFIDTNDNGVADAGEYKGESAAVGYSATGTNHADLREIRFDLVLRSRNQDQNFTEGFMQATENRAAAGVNDGYRRRVLTSTVKPRNLGFRGTAP